MPTKPAWTDGIITIPVESPSPKYRLTSAFLVGWSYRPLDRLLQLIPEEPARPRWPSEDDLVSPYRQLHNDIEGEAPSPSISNSFRCASPASWPNSGRVRYHKAPFMTEATVSQSTPPTNSGGVGFAANGHQILEDLLSAVHTTLSN